MQVVCLVENTAAEECFGAEHGLSLYIETGEHRILFDMGQTDLFAVNAQRMGIDLKAVELAVLSHGHYDHGGGLASFLKINDHAPVYISPYAFEPHYNGTEKYIGLDISLQGHARLRTAREKEDNSGIEIGQCFGGGRTGNTVSGNRITLYSGNGRERRYRLGSFGLTMRQGEEFLPDDFRHEQYLLIEEAEKRILFSGCSHNGIMDIMEWFRPDVLIGGFHFSKIQPGEELAEYARRLDEFDTIYYTCHCTGVEQFAFMKQYMRRLSYLSAGQRVRF